MVGQPFHPDGKNGLAVKTQKADNSGVNNIEPAAIGRLAAESVSHINDPSELRKIIGQQAESLSNYIRELTEIKKQPLITPDNKQQIADQLQLELHQDFCLRVGQALIDGVNGIDILRFKEAYEGYDELREQQECLVGRRMIVIESIAEARNRDCAPAQKEPPF